MNPRQSANLGASQNYSKSMTKKTVEPLKYEIANEFGVNLGPDTTARQNGSVGGEITKRLVSYGKSQISGRAGQ